MGLPIPYFAEQNFFKFLQILLKSFQILIFKKYFKIHLNSEKKQIYPMTWDFQFLSIPWNSLKIPLNVIKILPLNSFKFLYLQNSF